MILRVAVNVIGNQKIKHEMGARVEFMLAQQLYSHVGLLHLNSFFFHAALFF